MYAEVEACPITRVEFKGAIWTRVKKKLETHAYIQCFNPEACRVMVGLITVEFDPRRTRADYPRCCRGRH